MLTDGRTTDGRRTDGRTTDARVIGILIAHLGAFGSGELKTIDLRHGSLETGTTSKVEYVMVAS